MLGWSRLARIWRSLFRRGYAEEGVVKWARSKGYFAQSEAVGTKKVLTLRSYGG